MSVFVVTATASKPPELQESEDIPLMLPISASKIWSEKHAGNLDRTRAVLQDAVKKRFMEIYPGYEPFVRSCLGEVSREMLEELIPFARPRAEVYAEHERAEIVW